MRIAVLTGASSGLGREYALRIRQFFPDIDCVWLIARRADRLASLVNELGGEGFALAVPLDLTGSFAASYAALLADEKPEVRLLINSAGCGYLCDFDTADPAELRRMTDLNVTALTLLTRLTLPYMPQGARIINISSIASFVPNARMAVYSSTKAYVSAFSRVLGEELRPRKIAVTAVCPGPMKTEFLSIGRISGNSATFDRLPVCDPASTAEGSLRASRAGRPVYTPRFFYKFYRAAAKLLPQALLVKLVKT